MTTKGARNHGQTHVHAHGTNNKQCITYREKKIRPTCSKRETNAKTMRKGRGKARQGEVRQGKVAKHRQGYYY